MNRRKALYIIGGIIGIGIYKFPISQLVSYYKEEKARKDLNKEIIKLVECNKPIVEYMRINQPNLHLKFVSEVKNRGLDNLNYDNVLEELNNLEFVTVGGFFLSFSEIKESYNSSTTIRKLCL